MKPCSGISYTIDHKGNVLNTHAIYTQTDLKQPETCDFISGRVAVYTHRSPHKQTANEDCAAFIPYDSDSGVLIIADGLGGQPQGETASKTAIEKLHRSLQQAGKGTALREAILDGFEQANRSILKDANGAATTLAVIEVQNNIIRSYHVGDSMMLVCGQRGKVKLQSIAHSPVGYAVESGLIDMDDAIHHEERHLISNVVGATDMRIEIGTSLKLAKKDTLVLASDGLFDNLYVDEIIETIRKGMLSKAANNLASLAHQRMTTVTENLPSHPDDLSFILFRLS